jgi:hypothetical protein
MGDGEEVASRAKVRRDRSIRGQEALGVTRRLEALHRARPLARWLVGVCGAIVHIAMLSMCHTGQHLARGGAVALELVGDEHPWVYRPSL